MTLEQQLKDYERLTRIMRQMKKTKSDEMYFILRDKLYSGVKQYNINYQTSFIVNKKPR